MSKQVTLPVGASAEHDTCGSCKFFHRTGEDYAGIYRNQGWCRIKMPPNKERYALKHVEESDCDNRGPTAVKDIDSCDLYRNDGITYIVQREIKPCS